MLSREIALKITIIIIIIIKETVILDKLSEMVQLYSTALPDSSATTPYLPPSNQNKMKNSIVIKYKLKQHLLLESVLQ